VDIIDKLLHQCESVNYSKFSSANKLISIQQVNNNDSGKQTSPIPINTCQADNKFSVSGVDICNHNNPFLQSCELKYQLPLSNCDIKCGQLYKCQVEKQLPLLHNVKALPELLKR
jgi:hypothetical protein